MNVQINSIESLRKKILDLIEEMRINNKFNKVSEVQKLQKEYWKLEMNRDIPNIPVEIKNEILKYMMEFVPLGIDNEYFSKDNILDVLEQLTTGISRFEEVSGVYGCWDGLTLKINRNNGNDRQRNTIFHELAHCVTRCQIENDNFDRNIETKKFGITVGTYESPKSKEKHKSGKIWITQKEDNGPRIDLDKYNDAKKGWGFISEVIAEEMAQTLFYNKRPRPEKTSTGRYLQNIISLKSNWKSEFNMHYQQFGEDFVQNLYSEDATRGLKELTLLALNKHVGFQKEVSNMYEGSKEELERILVIFGAIRSTVEAYGSADHNKLEKILHECVELLQEHKKSRETDLSNITPQSISNATRASVRINPGEVSRKVEDSRIHIKTGIDKNTPNRNK